MQARSPGFSTRGLEGPNLRFEPLQGRRHGSDSDEATRLGLKPEATRLHLLYSPPPIFPRPLDVQASSAYTACMQYTLRNVPPLLDEALREKAREEGKSLNEVTIEALLVGVGLAGQPVKRRDLSDIAGSWVNDPATDEILQEQRRIDPELWR